MERSIAENLAQPDLQEQPLLLTNSPWLTAGDFPFVVWLAEKTHLSLDTSNRTRVVSGLGLAQATAIFPAFLFSDLQQLQTNCLPACQIGLELEVGN